MTRFLTLAALALALPLPLAAETRPDPVLEVVGPKGGIEISAAQVRMVELIDDVAGSQTLTIALDRDLNRRFADLTRANIGEILSIRICGTEVSAPRVMTEIPQAHFSVADDGSLNLARFVPVLSDAAPCPRHAPD